LYSFLAHRQLTRVMATHQGLGEVAGGLDGLGHQAERDAQPGQREGDHRQDTGRGHPLDRRGAGPEPDEQGDPGDDGQAQHGLGHAAEDVPVSTEGRKMAMVRNRAMMPSVMSMATEIAVPMAPMATPDQQDPGNDEVEVLGAAAGRAAEPGAQRAPEHVDEQQQEDDGHADQHQRHGRVAEHVAEPAAQHRRRVGHGVGQGAHGTGSFSFS
jgi:hypothetical protein